jgi:hypothetical protein
MERNTDQLLALGSSAAPTTLHLIDIENLVGCGKVTAEAVAEVRRVYMSASKAQVNDKYCIAAHPMNRNALLEGWRGASYLYRKGKDGADQALLNIYWGLQSPERFQRIVLGSGDFIFWQLVEDARSAGIKVDVLARKGSCSKLLNAYLIDSFNN